nr:TPA: hypothetical protein [Oryctes rhinoceros nudivirus]
MSNCPCEGRSDKERIQCLVYHFEKLMTARGLTLSRRQIQSILETTRLINVNLVNFEAKSATEELVESQILYTFIEDYCKFHPRFQQDGPNIGDIKLKTTFFQST